MNFLAHAYLSFNDPKIMVGNFIGDFVRGDLENKFEKSIINGVILHRDIDNFTDSHPVVKEAQKILKPHYGHYSLVITDMFFDYFLSVFWSQYDHRTLYEFSQYVYKILDEHKNILPNSFLPTFTDMKRQNWLICYGSIEGMKSALTEIAKRATFNSKMETAHMVLEKKEETFKECFDDFFPDLVAFSKMRLMALQYE